MDMVFLNGKYFILRIRPDGQEYDGEWKDGKQSGRGSFKTKNGSFKEAEWIDGKKIRWLSNNPLGNFISIGITTIRNDSDSDLLKISGSNL